MKIYLIIVLVFFTINVFANEDHDHEEKSHDEKSKEHSGKEEHDDDHEKQELPGGVTFFEDESGEFSLKEKVIQNFGIVLGVPVNVAGDVEIPEAAIVRSLKETSVFIQRGDRFKAFPVKIISSSNRKVRVTGVPSGVKVVLKGNNFLKTILLSLEEGPSEGHGH